MTNVGPAYEQRSLRIRVSRAGDMRIDTLNGRDHNIVPVVALVEGVVWPANVDEPEFVPAEVLAEHPIGWNGKPVTQSHPQDENGDYVSANYPWVYEKYAYGFIFNTDFRDNKLIMEAWLDPSRIRPGSVAERSLEALQNGEMVEVSVGAYITRKRVRGTYNGQSYSSIWQDIVPDHLAILAEGETGACSIEMGCGALRVAKTHLHTLTAKGIVITEVEVAKPESSATICAKHPTVKVEKDSVCPSCLAENPPPAKKTWKERFQEILARFTGLQSAEDMTTNDLGEKLERALRATEPGYLGVVAVKPEAHEVVYAVYPEDRVIYFQRTYSVSDAGEITLGEDRAEVQRVEKYEPVAAAAATPKPQGGCGCHKPAAAKQTEGETTMTMTEKINSLITSGRFTEDNRAFLSQASEATIDALMATPTPSQPSQPSTPAPSQPSTPAPSQPTAPTPTPSQPSSLSGASSQTMEQFIEAAPEHLRSSLRAAHQSNVAKRNQNLLALKASGRNTFSDAELMSKTDQEIEKLAALAVGTASAAADFSGRGLPTSTGNGDEVPEPPSLITAIQNRRKSGRSQE